MNSSQKNGVSEITLDDLGGMIARGFERVDKRIDSLEMRMEDGFGRIGALETKMENSFSSLQNQLDSARID